MQKYLKKEVLNKSYDYIICGAGCAGLSLAYRLCDSNFQDKRILLIDRERKNTNDRTWSFWAEETPFFNEVIFKSWKNLAFYSTGFSLNKSFNPYTYHTIKGIDFYNHTLKRIQETDHIKFTVEEITSIENSQDGGKVVTKNKTYVANQIFDSTVQSFPDKDKLFVWQHFKGWKIKTENDEFDDDQVTFMDFRIPQNEETRFVYILPFDKRTALVEATFFTKNICESKVYDEILKDYVDRILKVKNYEIIESEMGAIPMTTSEFKKINKNIIPIGTANGIVKGSTGYAFNRIQKESDWIVEQLATSVRLEHAYKPGMKYKCYDRTLLHVMITGKMSGSDIFSMMFGNNEVSKILKFLDEDTSLQEEIGLFRTLPFWPFLVGFMRENVFYLTKE